jgi:serine/threonine protein kinase/Tol biopolymer transport system component
MGLRIGTQLGPYEILSAIGAGGMGEVYRAHDGRLNRDVALKVLPEAFAADPDRMVRFEREARVLGALNHPNIAAIYGLEEFGSGRALVMELVEGQTLADRIAKGPIPIDEALPIAKQLSEALEYAHDHGVIHRDLKPANIKVTPDGTVKVLDFGLAKALMDEPVAADPRDSPTLSMAPTLAGAILGTAAYMSPEQAKGKPVDRRADIWAFGVVLFEMLTATPLYSAETAAEIVAAVMLKEPGFKALPNNTPPAIRNLLQRCLEKNLRQRLQHIGEARIVIEDVLSGAAPAASPVVIHPKSRERFYAALAAIAVVAALASAFLYFHGTTLETPLLRTTILPPENTTLDFNPGLGLPAVSPDGKRIVFGARTADGKAPLWVRSLDALTAQPLAGTDGATFPFWSPDSRFIAFFADGKLKKMDATGGPALTLADAPQGRGGSWSREGVIIFAPANTIGPLLRVSSAGGESTPLPAGEGRMPWFLPDGRHFLYQTLPGRADDQNGNGNLAIRVGSLDGGESKVVMEAGSNALYAQGYLLFLRNATLMAQPFDAKRLATTAEAVPIAEQIQTVLNSGTVGVFSASETGMLAYHTGAGAGGLLLTWFDRNGKPGAALGEPANIIGFQFAPDRKSLAAAIQDPSNTDIWIYDVSRGLRTRFTFDPAIDNNPVWSPDGRSIVFTSGRKGHFDLYRKSSNGSGAEELLYADNHEKTPTSWSPDGKFLLYYNNAVAGTGADVWALSLTPEQTGAPLKPFLVLQTPFNEFDAQFSPDGRWIAYTSDESRRAEIYVTPFPPPPSGSGGKRQISTAGGFLPRWRQDGKEIFYRGLDRRLMAAEVFPSGGTLEVGQVRPLFGATPYTTENINPLYDVSADGQHFLLRIFPEQKSGEPLTLVQNWTAGLRK